MRGSSGFFGIAVFNVLIALFCGFCWVGNIVKLAKCDWSVQGTWKGEIIHAIGLIGPAAVVTFWFDEN